MLADHGRGMTFLAADGVSPSNEGRGYVHAPDHPPRGSAGVAHRARAALPRAARRRRDRADAAGYPELEQHRGEIHRILTAEEERFGKTLERGLRLFEEVGRRGGDIAGEDAFRLHDTYGFPLELTQ